MLKTQKAAALLTSLMMLLSLLPVSAPAEETEPEVICSDFSAPEGVITDYTIKASDDASVSFEPESGAAEAIRIHSGTVTLSNEGTSAERIIVDGDATVILAGVSVEPAAAAALTDSISNALQAVDAGSQLEGKRFLCYRDPVRRRPPDSGRRQRIRRHRRKPYQPERGRNRDCLL